MHTKSKSIHLVAETPPRLSKIAMTKSHNKSIHFLVIAIYFNTFDRRFLCDVDRFIIFLVQGIGTLHAYEVAFSTAKTSHQGVGRIAYNVVHLNDHHGYDPHNGIFRAPFSGVYSFTVFIFFYRVSI